MSPLPATLLVFNTADRLLRGDLFHTVTASSVANDLSAFDPAWPVVGVGTTNWLKRHGEVIPDGRVSDLHFWWADPEGERVGQIIDVKAQKPSPSGPELKTPQYGIDDEDANFPFLVLAVCDPTQVITWTLSGVDSVHEWLKQQLASVNMGVAGLQLRGRFGAVKTTDAYNIPISGMNLSGGYRGDEYFRTGQYESGEWILNGVYVANPSLQPFISVPGMPLHLHGWQPGIMEGGHIVSAQAADVTATVWPMDDLVLKINNVAKAMNPVKGE